MYSSILELLCGQLDVLRPGSGAAAAPHAPELAAALKPLGELRAALEARLQVRLGAVPVQCVQLCCGSEAAGRAADGAGGVPAGRAVVSQL